MRAKAGIEITSWTAERGGHGVLLDSGELSGWFDEADDRGTTEVDEVGHVSVGGSGGRGGGDQRAPAGGRLFEAPTGAAPTVYSGVAEIAGYFRDVCGRNMAHEVRDAVATDAGLAYTRHCRYPDGAAVVCATTATLRGGKITTQTAVQVWDS